MGREYEDLKYLRIPKGRIYEAPDWFSRVDEELEQVIRGLDLVLKAGHSNNGSNWNATGQA